MTTCEEMLRDRGCTRVERAADLAPCLAAATPPEPALRGRGGARDFDVFLHGEDRVGVKYARAVIEHCAAGGRDARERGRDEGRDARERGRDEGRDAIIVSVEGPTPFTRRECEGERVQFLCARDVVVNVTRHALVPRHERVPRGPVDAAHLPRILETDRVVQYYGWPPGTVVRVWRCFGGHEPIPYFRVVAPVCAG